MSNLMIHRRRFASDLCLLLAQEVSSRRAPGAGPMEVRMATKLTKLRKLTPCIDHNTPSSDGERPSAGLQVAVADRLEAHSVNSRAGCLQARCRLIFTLGLLLAISGGLTTSPPHHQHHWEAQTPQVTGGSSTFITNGQQSLRTHPVASAGTAIEQLNGAQSSTPPPSLPALINRSGLANNQTNGPSSELTELQRALSSVGVIGERKKSLDEMRGQSSQLMPKAASQDHMLASASKKKKKKMMKKKQKKMEKKHKEWKKGKKHKKVSGSGDLLRKRSTLAN